MSDARNYGGNLTWEIDECIVAQGACGDNLTWTLVNTGLLTVSGTGDMNASPWPNAKVILGHSGGSTAGRLECEKIAQDPQSAAMMDLIMDNIRIDAGFVYSHSMGSFHQGFQQLVDKGENDAISRYKRMTTSAQRQLEGLIRQLDKLAAQQ